MPRPGKARMTLIPCGFSRSCSLLVTCNSREIAPRTTSFAGALCTPRLSSVRAHQVGHAEHRDGVDGFETGKSGAVGRIAHVLVRGDPGRHRGAAALKRNLARGGDLLQCAGGPDLLELD